ncbi:MAG TPA: hypothetical protein VGP00_00095 [Nocardioides sp.]|nr:hypothetical protein [Nocardioides sp.]
MLPLRPLAPNGTSEGPQGPIRALALTGLSMALLAALVGPTAAFVVLSLAAIALGSAAVLGRRARRAATTTPIGSAAPTAGLSPADTEAVTPDVLTERLRVLYDDHVEKVNMALGEGREDLVQELSDSYMDEALSLIAGGARPSANRFPAR